MVLGSPLDLVGIVLTFLLAPPELLLVDLHSHVGVFSAPLLVGELAPPLLYPRKLLKIITRGL
jgi:hypothetical protein